MSYPSSFITYCTLINNRLTSLRKRVLYILWHEKKPLKAYDVLHQLTQMKINAKPSTVYRVLDYFIACNLVHKIESIQSYVLCHAPIEQLANEILLVCKTCHAVDETHDQNLLNLIKELAKLNGFTIGQDAIELKGVCQICGLAQEST